MRHTRLLRVGRMLSPSPPDPLSHTGERGIWLPFPAPGRGEFGSPSPLVGDKRSAGGGLVGGWGRNISLQKFYNDSSSCANDRATCCTCASSAPLSG